VRGMREIAGEDEEKEGKEEERQRRKERWKKEKKRRREREDRKQKRKKERKRRGDEETGTIVPVFGMSDQIRQSALCFSLRDWRYSLTKDLLTF